MAGRVAIITVNHGTARALLQRLQRYVQHLDGIEARVILVDNASPGDDGEVLRSGVAALQPLPVPVEVILSPVNGGFAAGNNVAFARLRREASPPDAVVLLNPDAEPEPGAIQALFEGLVAAPRSGFAGPVLINDDGSTWSGAFNFPSWQIEILRPLGIGIVDRFSPLLAATDAGPARVDWLSGASLMIRWTAIQALGDLDEGYFLYHEEVDYQREGARQGWEAWHIPAARVRHAAGETTGVVDGQIRRGRTPAYLFESWVRYSVKQRGAAATRIVATLRLVTIMLGQLKLILQGRGISLPQRYLRDYLAQVVLRRLSPPPSSERAGKTAQAMVATSGP
ncbi:MAG: glycosyltransferase family 2 protein [Pseudomonadota bacterium]